MHPVKHFRTITRHRHLVMKNCFAVGLYKRGLLHDLSKYGPTEFWAGAKYYEGTHSPTLEERKAEGRSLAWMHHKGQNRHHFEYWNDLNPKTRLYEPVEMPTEFLVEMVMDRIAASQNYKGKDYTDAAPLEYLEHAGYNPRMHPETYRKLRFLLTMLKNRGREETFRFIKETVLWELPFGEESI